MRINIKEFLDCLPTIMSQCISNNTLEVLPKIFAAAPIE